MENKSEVADSAVAHTTAKQKYHIERSSWDISDSADHIQKLNKEQKTASLTRAASVLMELPNWEIWPMKISAPIIGLVSLFPGYILTSAFRKALLLDHYGRRSSYLATMGIPAVFGAMGHNIVITRNILEQETKCPVCLQVKSAVLLLVSGFVYPAILSPITCYPIASGVKNMYFPKFHKQPREVLNFTRTVFKTVQSRYFAAGALQIVVAMGITHFEQKCYLDVLLPVLRGERVMQNPKRNDEILKP